MYTKRFIITILFAGTVASLFPQETARERIARQRGGEPRQPVSGVNITAGQINRYNDDNLENAKWLRIIYRHLDLTKEANAPLYYPVVPTDGKTSLFSVIFKLLQEGTITAYEYLDGREAFTDEYRINFQELLNRFDIYYETAGGKLTVNDADIPGNEVVGYFVKEAYYFNTSNSTFGVKQLAICPVLYRSDEYNATTRYPLFWIPYDAIAPYARRIQVMSSSLNNSMSGTVDDFFRMRKYHGEIYKAQNPGNLAISQYATTPEEVKAEQERIERELADFGKNLSKQETPAFSPSKQPKTNRRAQRRATATPSPAAANSMRDRRY